MFFCSIAGRTSQQVNADRASPRGWGRRVSELAWTGSPELMIKFLGLCVLVDVKMAT